MLYRCPSPVDLDFCNAKTYNLYTLSSPHPVFEHVWAPIARSASSRLPPQRFSRCRSLNPPGLGIYKASRPQFTVVASSLCAEKSLLHLFGLHENGGWGKGALRAKSERSGPLERAERPPRRALRARLRAVRRARVRRAPSQALHRVPAQPAAESWKQDQTLDILAAEAPLFLPPLDPVTLGGSAALGRDRQRLRARFCQADSQYG